MVECLESMVEGQTAKPSAVTLINLSRHHEWPEVKSGEDTISTGPPQLLRNRSSTDDGRM
jgi:hypothetical protein